MSEDLSNKKCIPCEGGIPAFNSDEIEKYLLKINNWNAAQDENNNFYLIKEFTFKNFLESQNFVNKAGEIAENESHHPDISLGYGYCLILIHTHAIKGLSINDFILASKIDLISI